MNTFERRPVLVATLVAALASMVLPDAVCAAEPPADWQIANAVDDVLMDDAAVMGDAIDVAAEQGIVTLGGEVRWWARDERLRNDKYADVSDEKIEDAVQDVFQYNPRVAPFDTDVSSDDGYVTLRGRVDNAKAKRAAARDARGIVGVWAVANKIKVRPGTPSDKQIRKDIQSQLFWSPFVDSNEVTVEVRDGVAELYGTVETWGEREGAAENAREGGAVAADNSISVNQGPEFYAP